MSTQSVMLSNHLITHLISNSDHSVQISFPYHCPSLCSAGLPRVGNAFFWIQSDKILTNINWPDFGVRHVGRGEIWKIVRQQEKYFLKVPFPQTVFTSASFHLQFMVTNLYPFTWDCPCFNIKIGWDCPTFYTKVLVTPWSWANQEG